MVFSSVPFLFYFLPALIALYFLTPWKNPVLLVMSLLFYAWGEGAYAAIILTSIAANHGFARVIEASAGARRNWFLGVGVAFKIYYVVAWRSGRLSIRASRRRI